MNKKYLVTVALLVVFLIVFVPLASTNPDGLEKVAQTYDANEQANLWGGVIADYSISAIGNQYLSTLIAGTIGTFMVLIVALAVGKLTPKNRS